MVLRKIAETATTITLGWDPVPGAEGWLFYKDGVRVSRSFDQAKRTVKFSKPGVYRVQAINFNVIDQATYPAVVPVYKKVAPRVAYKEGGSDARFCVINQPGVFQIPPGQPNAGKYTDESGAIYTNADGLDESGIRSDGPAVTGAKQIDGRPYCSLPTMGDPTLNTGSWAI